MSSGGVIQRQPTAPAALRAPDSARCTPAVVIAARQAALPLWTAAESGIDGSPKRSLGQHLDHSTALGLGRRNTFPRRRIGLDVERAGLGAQKRCKLLFFCSTPCLIRSCLLRRRALSPNGTPGEARDAGWSFSPARAVSQELDCLNSNKLAYLRVRGPQGTAAPPPGSCRVSTVPSQCLSVFFVLDQRTQDRSTGTEKGRLLITRRHATSERKNGQIRERRAFVVGILTQNIPFLDDNMACQGRCRPSAV